MRAVGGGTGRFASLNKRVGMIVVRSPQLRRQVTELLANAGYVDNTFVSDAEAAALSLRYGRNMDFVLCEASPKYRDHVPLAKFIRRDQLCTTPQVPLLVFSDAWTPEALVEARNIGVSGMVAFPCTAQGFLRRFVNAVCNPPPFIVCDTYCGPDRRFNVGAGTYKGPLRRASDSVAPAAPQLESASEMAKKAGAMGQAQLMRKLKESKE